MQKTLVATTALTSLAFGAGANEPENGTVTETLKTDAAVVAERVENSAEVVGDKVAETANEAVEATRNAAPDAKREVEGAMAEGENNVETLAAKAEMGNTRELDDIADSSQMAPIDLDNRSEFLRASDIIGADIYTVSAELDTGEWFATPRYTEVAEEWENIGNVTEIVVGPEGNIRGLIAEVGGFLGLGDAHVMIDMDDLHRTQPDDDGAFVFVTRLSEKELESKQPVEKEWWQ